VLLDSASLYKVKRIKLTYSLVEHKGPRLGRIYRLTKKTKVTETVQRIKGLKLG